MENRNAAQWKFVAGSAYQLDAEIDENMTVPRLEALKGLQGTLENQGVLEQIWRKRIGS